MKQHPTLPGGRVPDKPSPKATFIYNRGRHQATFLAYCGSPAEALAVWHDLQTVDGSRLERDNDSVYFIVPLERLDEAIVELERSGYATTDGDSETSPAEDPDDDR